MSLKTIVGSGSAIQNKKFGSGSGINHSGSAILQNTLAFDRSLEFMKDWYLVYHLVYSVVSEVAGQFVLLSAVDPLPAEVLVVHVPGLAVLQP